MKKSLSIIFTSLLLLTFAFVSCEKEDLGTASIYGIVTDKATGEPIKSAGVELLPVGLKTITGTDGRFEFNNLKAGSYQVYIIQAGYVEVLSSNIELSQGQSLQRDVQMELLPPALRVVDDSRVDILELDFGDDVSDLTRSFNLFNDGAETLEWEVTYNANWIKSVSKTNGKLQAGKTQPLVVTIDRNLLNSDVNTTKLHIISNNGSKQLSIKAIGGELAVINTLPITNLKRNSAVLNAEVISEGTPKYNELGFVYSLSSMPTVENCIKKLPYTLIQDNKYSSTLANLIPNQTYYVRAYAVNSGKYAYSNNEVSFVPQNTKATVTTQPVTEIVRSRGCATFIGTIEDMGDPSYTERGFVYSTMPYPTVESSTKVVVYGKGLGEYMANVSGLTLGYTYYVRAYATNEEGTSYGNEELADFNTILPEVETMSVTVKNANTVYMVGTIKESGDPVYTERGFIYGQTQNLTLDNFSVTKVIVSNNVSFQFEKEVTVTLGNSLWYVRAYARSSAGVAYGKILTMKDPDYVDYWALPTFNFNAAKYYVYPEVGAMDWDNAMAYCDKINVAGYDDWYLPSKNELNAMYINKAEIGGLSSTYYWSSTENFSSGAWYQNFNNGRQDTNNRSNTFRVRCVRRD